MARAIHLTHEPFCVCISRVLCCVGKPKFDLWFSGHAAVNPTKGGLARYPCKAFDVYCEFNSALHTVYSMKAPESVDQAAR